ncbi:hypothetical protein HDU96_001107 [Phlyctochytrium bullatum]|nr:hypothetical protein HDU96_001107 [Phlyctochytrium bullatum]
MHAKIAFFSAALACLASTVVARSGSGLEFGIPPLDRRDHPTDASSMMYSSAAPLAIPTDSAATPLIPSSGKVTYSYNNLSVTDNYSPTAADFAMDDWVCVEDNGSLDPSWNSLDCVDATEDFECDFDPIVPPSTPGTTPPSPPENATPSQPPAVVTSVAPVAPGPQTGTNILNGATQAATGKNFAAGVAVALAAIVASMF